jgi:hypothetical protein
MNIDFQSLIDLPYIAIVIMLGYIAKKYKFKLFTTDWTIFAIASFVSLVFLVQDFAMGGDWFEHAKLNFLNYLFAIAFHSLFLKQLERRVKDEKENLK